uniref:M-phase phosphoprotein 9 n=1 Tax=Mus musculus TaxID=10090 RepID=D6RDQ9_MOUSE
MEDFDLVENLQKTSPSVESDIKSAPQSLGLSLHANREDRATCHSRDSGSPHCFKTRPTEQWPD